ncbi:MAG: homoserine kinase [Rickettsiales bacterium]
MAVYTHLSNEEIAALLAGHYRIGRFAFAVGIASGVENSNFLVVTDDDAGREQKQILTLYEKRVEASELPFFLELLQHLAARGVACPQPIARTDGALFGTLRGRPAAMVSFLHGNSRTVISAAHTGEVGRALAQLHVAGEGFARQRENRLSLAGWSDLAQKLEGKLDAIAPGLDALAAETLFEIRAQWGAVCALPRGIIHADFFPDNVFFEGEKLSGVIDFYFACVDAWAYDLAIAINAWCFEPTGEFNAEKSQRMIAEYQRVRPLGEAEIEALPLLLRGAALRFFLTRAHDWIHRTPGAHVVLLDPLEYAGKLRFYRNNMVSGGW